MKRHNQIYVLHDVNIHGITLGSSYHVCLENFDLTYRREVVPEQDVIVVTTEQLREIWETAYQNGRFDGKPPIGPFSFEEYLTIKGINI
jgi:hypothetical protein